MTMTKSLPVPRPQLPYLQNEMTGHSDFEKSFYGQGPMIVSQGLTRSFSHRITLEVGPLGHVGF